MRNRGFTIVELLIVIVVVGVLVSITIVSYGGIQERARVASANSDLALLAKAVNVARINVDKELRTITGSNCTACLDRAVYELSLDRISTASGINLSSLKKGDPWGNVYRIDENEGEGATPCASRDAIWLMTTGKTGIITPVIQFYNCTG